MSTATASVSRLRVEVRSFERERDEMVATFALPILLLIVLGSVLDGNVAGTDVAFSQYLLAGIIASGALSVGFASLAAAIAVERHDGTLRRLASTPMSPAAYVLGKIGLVLTVVIIQVVLLLAVGRIALGTELPDPSRWGTIGWVLGAGLVASAAAGVAFSTLISSPRSANAMVTVPYLGLSLISGVFFPFGDMPGWLQGIASIFPLRWMTLGLRSAFLPESFAAAEPGGGWQHGTILAVLAAWAIGGFVVSVLTLRRTR